MTQRMFLSLLFLGSLGTASYIAAERLYTGVGGSVFAFCLAFIFLTPMLFLSPRATLRPWWTFALVFLLISACLIYFTPEDGAVGGIGLDFNPDREQVGQWLAGVFFILSAGFIAWKSYRWRRK